MASFRDKKSKQTAVISLQLENGSGDLRGAEAAKSALFRPFRQIVEDGKPIGKLTYVFFDNQRGQHFVLGSLVRTPGSRLLFFPGVKGRRVNWHSRDNRITPVVTNPSETLDHITLESDLGTWHVTILSEGKKETRLPRMPSYTVDKNLVFWFGMSIRKAECLEPTPASIQLSMGSTSADMERRIAIIYDSRDKAVFRITQLPTDAPMTGEEFISFEFFVDKTGWAFTNNAMGGPGGTSLLSPIAVPAQTLTRVDKIEFTGLTGNVVLVVYSLQGKLRDETIYWTATPPK